jgi:hypothetical protein
MIEELKVEMRLAVGAFQAGKIQLSAAAGKA